MKKTNVRRDAKISKTNNKKNGKSTPQTSKIFAVAGRPDGDH